MEKPKGVEILIIIADNNSNGTAKSIVDEFAKLAEIPICYSIEKTRGIAAARNNVLRQAQSNSITDLAFIDDDEYVDKDWLMTLWGYYLSSDADVVNGPVITTYPDPDTPKWIIKGGIHQMQIHRTGKELEWAPTNNVLFNFKKIVIQKDIWFDESFGLTGGSDADFFFRANLEGARILWNKSAIVYAPLERSRFTLGYLLMYSFRCSNEPRRFKDIHSNQKIKLWFFAFYQIFKGIFWVLLGGIFGKHRIYFGLARFTTGTGLLLGLLGLFVKIEQYR